MKKVIVSIVLAFVVCSLGMAQSNSAAIQQLEVESSDVKENNPEIDASLYLGNYYSAEFNFGIEIFQEDDALMATSDGQTLHVLTPIGEHKYETKEIGAVMEFLPDENKFNLHQSGMTVEFVKQED